MVVNTPHPKKMLKFFIDILRSFTIETLDFDMSVLNLLEQLPTDHSTCIAPSQGEIRAAILHLKNKAPGETGLTPQIFKSILRDDQCLDYLFDIASDIWINESCTSQWDIGRLII